MAKVKQNVKLRIRNQIEFSKRYNLAERHEESSGICTGFTSGALASAPFMGEDLSSPILNCHSINEGLSPSEGIQQLKVPIPKLNLKDSTSLSLGQKEQSFRQQLVE